MSESAPSRPHARVFGHYLALAAAEAAGPFLQLLTLGMLTAVLGRAEYGRINVFLLPVQVLFLLGISWTAPALLTFGKKEWTDAQHCRTTFWNRAVLLAAALGAVALVLYGASDRFVEYFGLPPYSIHLAFAFVAGMALSDFLRGLLQVTGRMRTYALSVTLERVLTAAGVACLWLAWVEGSVTNALAAMTVALFASVALCLPASGVREFVGPFSATRDGLVRMVRFSAPMLLVSFGSYLVATVDVYFIERHHTLADVGGYQFAYKLMSFLEKFGLAVGTVVGPILIGYAAQGRVEPIHTATGRILPKLVLLWGAALGAAFVGLELLLPVFFSSEFHDAPRFLGVLLVALAFSPFLAMYYPLYYGAEKTLRLALVTNTIGFTNLGLDVLLVPAHGAIGAAWATAGAYAAGAAAIVATVPLARRGDLLQQAALLAPCLGFLAAVQTTSGWGIHAAAWVALLGVTLAVARIFRIFRPGDDEVFARVGLPPSLCRALAWVGRWVGGVAAAETEPPPDAAPPDAPVPPKAEPPIQAGGGGGGPDHD